MSQTINPGAVAAATGAGDVVQADGLNEFHTTDHLFATQVSHLRRRLALTETRARLIAALAFKEVPK